MKWQTVSIFISSTFKDMHSERDILVKQVFPKLREKLLPYRIKLVDIDLRWGITEEQSENDKTIEFCLDSIEGCRPFFLGILGERYGWIPDKDQDELKNKFPGLNLSEKISITAMEIIHGVLSQNPDNKELKESKGALEKLVSAFADNESAESNALFFFRDPTFEKSMPADLLEIVKSESAEHHAKLEKLKEEIRNHPLKNKPVENYPCKFKGLAIDWELIQDEAPENVKTFVEAYADTGIIPAEAYPTLPADVKFWLKQNSTILLDNLESFADDVYDHLWSLFCEAFPELNQPPVAAADANLLEDDEHLRFLDEITELFIGRDDIREKIKTEPGTFPIIITGSTGTGKSALLARMVKDWEQDHAKGKAIVHFSGVSLLGNHAEGLFQRLIRLIGDITGQPIEQDVDPEFITFGLKHLIDNISSNNEVLIAIDGLDMICGHGGLDLRWIPEKLKTNVTIILTLSDDQPNSNHNFNQLIRLKASFLQIPVFRKEERMMLIRQLPALSAKTMDIRHINLLSDHPAANLPLFLTIALDELRIFGSYERLEKRIHSFPEQTGKEGLEAIYSQMLKRLEREIGKEAVSRPLSLLSCAVTGLKESEIAQLCPDIPSGDLALLWRELRSHLQTKNGALGFYHQSLERAIQKEYLLDDEVKREYHAQLADFFEDHPEKERALSELLEHYYICIELDKMQLLLSDLQNFLVMRKRMPGQLPVWWDKAGLPKPLDILHESLCEQFDSYNGILNNNEGVTLGFWAPQGDEKTISLYNEENDALINPILDPLREDILIELIRLTNQFRIESDAAFFIRFKIMAIFEKEYGAVHARTLEALAACLLTILSKMDEKSGMAYSTKVLLATSTYLPQKHPVNISLLRQIHIFMMAKNRTNDLNEGFRELMDAFEDETGCDKLRELPQDIPLRKRQLINLKAIILIHHSQLLRINGHIKEAERFCRETVDYTESHLGSMHELTIEALQNLAMLHMDSLRDFEYGEKILKEAIRRADERIGKHTELGLTLINNLSTSYGNSGRFNEGLPFYREAVKRKLKIYGEYNTSTLHSIYNLAWCLSKMGEYEEAEKHCRTAVNSFRKLGEFHINEAITMQVHLSDILQKASKDTEAEAVYTEAYTRFYELPESKREWSTYYMVTTHLAKKLKRSGQQEKALEIQWEQLEKLRSIEDAATHLKGLYNVMHRELAEQLQIQKHNNNPDQVLAFTLDLIRLHEVLFDENHPDLLHWKTQLGESLNSIGRYKDAEKILRDVVERLELVKGKSHPKSRLAAFQLVKALNELGLKEEAKQIMKAAVEAGMERNTDTESLRKEQIETIELEFGPEHPNTLKALDETGNELLEDNKIGPAIKYFSMAFERSEKAYGPLAEETLKRGRQMAEIYWRIGNFAEAEPMIRRIAEAYEQTKGLSAAETMEALDELGRILTEMEEYAEAIRIYEKNLEGKRSIFGNEDLSTLKSLTSLLELYAQNNDKEKHAEHLSMLYESLENLCKPDSVKTLTDKYLDLAIIARQNQIEAQVNSIRIQQEKGGAEYLGNEQEELEKTAMSMLPDPQHAKHPDGAEEIEILVDLLNRLKPHQIALELWESLCENIENNLPEYDPVRQIPRFNLSLWLIKYEFFTRATENLAKVWSEGNMKTFAVLQAGQTSLNLIAYETDKETISKVVDQMTSDLMSYVDPKLAEVQYFNTQMAAYFMQNEEYSKAAKIYSDILDRMPSGEGHHLNFANEIRANMGEALAIIGNIDEGVGLCGDAWKFFAEDQQKMIYYGHVACSLANVLELAGQAESVNELRNFAVQHADLLLRNVYENPDFTSVLSQLLKINNLANAAEKTGAFEILERILNVMAIVQKRINHIGPMNDTLWRKLGNINNLENKEECYSFAVNMWEQTEQHEMIEKLKSIFNE